MLRNDAMQNFPAVYEMYPFELIEVKKRKGKEKETRDVGFDGSLSQKELLPPEHGIKAHLHHAV